jgi:hypothetical protein
MQALDVYLNNLLSQEKAGLKRLRENWLAIQKKMRQK